MPCRRAVRPALGAAGTPVPVDGAELCPGSGTARAWGAASAAPSVSDRGFRHGRTVASPTRVSCVAFSRLHERFSGWKVFEIVRGNMSSAVEERFLWVE